MKRTRQVFHREGDDVPKYVSGLRQFDGEDVCKTYTLLFILTKIGVPVEYAERMKENADR